MTRHPMTMMATGDEPGALRRGAATSIAALCAIVALVLCGPIQSPTGLRLVCLLVGVLGAGLVTARYPRLREAIRVGIVILFVLAAVDIASRPLLEKRLYYREFERYAIHSPDWIGLGRFEPNVAFRGRVSGDLAAKSGMPSCREPREIAFQTDARGFRNDGLDLSRPVQVVVLGDSFGLGIGTSQHDIWPSLLATRYGLRVYNLSFPGSPWDELMNLKIELPRIPHDNATVVLWAIYTGNDLDDDYGDGLEPQPIRSWLARCRVRWTTFQNRSPIRQLIFRIRASTGSAAAKQTLVRTLPDGASVLFYRSTIEAAQRTREEVLAHPHLAPLTRTFAEMARYAGAEGVRVVVLMLPTKDQIYADLLQPETASRPFRTGFHPAAFARVVEQLSAHNRLEFHDLGFPLWTAAGDLFQKNDALLWWRDDTHLNVLGNSALADAVYQGVLRPGPAPDLRPDRRSPLPATTGADFPVPPATGR